MENAVKFAHSLSPKAILFFYHRHVQVGINTQVLKYVEMNLSEACNVPPIVKIDCGRMRSLEKKLKVAFIVSAIALSCIGLAFVHSAGSYWGTVHYADSFPFIVKQAIYMAVSIGIAFFIMKSPLTSNPKTWKVIYWLAVLALVAVKIPGIGAFRNGSQSWIVFGPLSIQPAEFAKIALIAMLASNLQARVKRERRIQIKSYWVYSFCRQV